jgi:hypothetical protein
LNGDDGVGEITPEGFRELLFDYASKKGIDPV